MAQRSRGLSGFGFLEIYPNELVLQRFLHEGTMLAALRKSNAKEILLHNRFPTSNDNHVIANHPVMAINDVYKNNYFLVHNGHVSNHKELIKEHARLGIKYSSTVDGEHNDSEALLHELVLVIEGIKKPSEFNAKGSSAFVMIQTDKLNRPANLFYGRGAWSQLTMSKVMSNTDIRLLIIRSVGADRDVPSNVLHRLSYIDGAEEETPMIFGDEEYEEKKRKNREAAHAGLPTIQHGARVEDEVLDRAIEKATNIEIPWSIAGARIGIFEETIRDVILDRPLDSRLLISLLQNNLVRLTIASRDRMTRIKIEMESLMIDGATMTESQIISAYQIQKINLELLRNMMSTKYHSATLL